MSQGAIKCYADFYKFISTELSACPQPLIDQKVKAGARRFCQDSERWIVTLDSQNLVAKQAEYVLDWKECSDIVRIDEVRFNTKDNVALGYHGIVKDAEDYDFSPPDILKLRQAIIPAADEVNGLEVNAVMVPQFGEWPFNENDETRAFLNLWAEGIIARAMYELLRMGKKRWSDNGLAAQYLADYNGKVTLAKTENSRKHSRRTTGLRG
jgi:hypothetical protein